MLRNIPLSCRETLHESSQVLTSIWLQALRGAADSFGIITHFHLRTVAAPERVVLFSFDIAGIVDDIDEATNAFLQIQKVVQDSEIVDQYLSFGFYIHERMWTIWGVYLGEKDHFESHVSVSKCFSSITIQETLGSMAPFSMPL